ncbi:sigma-54 dependent transcriptional regulator [Aquisalimonas sp.]|uniref:sigma-54-dependent transcriptional regulator n=1 Tax=Aquisalimonas sp. TaxID=1872621 RepID=UPI0025BC25F0|nr:sigma-54 dependent transcriptional regulator [Aquisalimonas sp.]
MIASSILVVDDEPDIRSLVQEILEDEGYQVRVAADAAGTRQALRHRRPDLILLDIWMPDTDGIALLKEWSEGGGPPCPVVMISGHGSVESAVEATRLGAYDFLEKPLSLARLLVVVERALEADRLARELRGLRAESDGVDQPLGQSRVMQELRAQARRIAGHNTWVLITGEAGCGKRNFARYLHQNSPRSGRPFVEVAAGSLAGGSSAAQELFGSERDGRVSYGRLEQANNGTLFIDEVADLDMGAQVRLLSALTGQKFHRVGGAEPVAVDVRVLAATRTNLEAQVRAGHFREDLYYHLNVVPLHIPPLREHPEDIPELLAFYLERFVNREKLPRRRFSDAAQNRLRDHSWSGNVRELKNLVQRLLILGEGEEITAEEVNAALGSGAGAGVEAPATPFDQPLREARENFERMYLRHQLREVGGSVGELAKLAGMERTHLYRKLKALGINPHDF